MTPACECVEAVWEKETPIGEAIDKSDMFVPTPTESCSEHTALGTETRRNGALTAYAGTQSHRRTAGRTTSNLPEADEVELELDVLRRRKSGEELGGSTAGDPRTTIWSGRWSRETKGNAEAWSLLQASRAT
ncbi:hypothetical protein B0H19DRAFT_1055588 [Mycena capillaripes]|nr:hypothetical protein B0H19DRAFT_1055588 [Mycena capillaripes]